MHGRARMDFRNHLFIDSRTRNRETLLDVIRMTNKSYLIVHEEALSDIGKGLYTKSTLVRKDKWEIERNGVLRTSVLF